MEKTNVIRGPGGVDQVDSEIEDEVELDAPANEDELTREQLLIKHNRAELVAAGRDVVTKIKQFELERTAINQKMTAERDTLQAKGISKKALAMAVQVSKFSDDDLDGFFVSLDILLESIERPFQADLFKGDAKESPTGKTATG